VFAAVEDSLTGCLSLRVLDDFAKESQRDAAIYLSIERSPEFDDEADARDGSAEADDGQLFVDVKLEKVGLVGFDEGGHAVQIEGCPVLFHDFGSLEGLQHLGEADLANLHLYLSLCPPGRLGTTFFLEQRFRYVIGLMVGGRIGSG
jgi:hypothetical protein